MTSFIGTAGDDNLTGTFTYDSFDLSLGGADTAKGGGGGDTFQMGATLSVDDRLDGGTSGDYVYLQGDYTAGLKLTAATAVNMEAFYFYSGFSYDITFADATNTTNSGMTINGGGLLAANHLYFDGSKETTSTFYVYGGPGDDRLIGGGGADSFYLYYGGHDVAAGGGSQDAFSFNEFLDPDDRVNGGDGRDYLYLNGDYNLTFKPNTVKAIEQTYLADGHDYRLKLNDGTIGAGEVMAIDAYQLTGSHKALIDASKETDGRAFLTGGEGRDTLVGGAADDQFTGNAGGDFLYGGDGDDWLWGGPGHDELSGGGGQDTFYFQDGDSSAGNPDLITDLALSDIVDISQIDADTTQQYDQTFTLVNHFHGVAGELTLDYDSGAGVTHFLMDTDGDAVADQTIDATGNRTSFTQFLY